MEIRDIQGWAGEYGATEDGRIYSFINNKFLKPGLGKRGYLVVCLRQKTQCVHKLIANTFLPPSEKKCTNHIDGNKTNNHVSNLEWCTQAENVLHCFRVLGRKINEANIQRAIRMGKQSAKKVLRSDGTIFNSTVEASKETGANIAGIGNVCRGKQKLCGGYGWKYV